jgi:hypothetical protein
MFHKHLLLINYFMIGIKQEKLEVYECKYVFVSLSNIIFQYASITSVKLSDRTSALRY